MNFDDSSLPPVRPEDTAALVTAVAGSVLLPGDAGYDDERAVFNLNHELMPAVIVVAQSAIDVKAAVTFAAGQHRRQGAAQQFGDDEAPGVPVGAVDQHVSLHDGNSSRPSRPARVTDLT